MVSVCLPSDALLQHLPSYLGLSYLGRGCDGAQAWLRGATLCTRSGAVAERSYCTPKVSGGGSEEQPHIQEAVAVLAQEGLEELSHVEGQEGWR